MYVEFYKRDKFGRYTNVGHAIMDYMPQKGDTVLIEKEFCEDDELHTVDNVAIRIKECGEVSYGVQFKNYEEE